MAINRFNYEFLIETEREALYVLDDFCIISSWEMVEFNKIDNSGKDIGEYLCVSNYCLSVYKKHILFV